MSDQTSPFPIKPFRFGVQLQQTETGAQWVELARRTEAHGYAVATMPDHFDAQFAPIPALQAILSATTTLRAGALVFDNDYRHPLVLAKELATMDVLSGGRVEIGLGAGWMISDYEQAGIDYDRPGVRIDRFVEGLAIIKGVMGDEPFTYDGDHYSISAHHGFPKPSQRPHPPVIIGGGGPRVLGIAAREADVVGVNGTLDAGVIGAEAISTMTRDAVADKVAIVADAARAAGRIDHIEMNVRAFFVSVTDDRDGQISGMADMIGVEDRMIAESPFALVGDVDEICDTLVARREEFGFSYVIVGAGELDAFAPVVARLAGT